MININNFKNFNINPSNIYIYLRVSTKSQANLSNGLDNQIKLCEDYVKNILNKSVKSINLIEHYVDIGSSYNYKNTLKQLNKLLKNINSNDLILVGDTSRLGRNTFQVFQLLKKIRETNSHIIAVSDNLCYNNNRLMDKKFYHKIIDAEESSDLKSLKILNRIEHLKQNGGWLGRAPYGYKILKINNIPKLYKNKIELNIVKKMEIQFKLTTDFVQVANYLNSHKLLNRKNISWNNIAIKNILKKHYPSLFLNLKSNSNSNFTNLSNIPDDPDDPDDQDDKNDKNDPNDQDNIDIQSNLKISKLSIK